MMEAGFRWLFLDFTGMRAMSDLGTEIHLHARVFRAGCDWYADIDDHTIVNRTLPVEDYPALPAMPGKRLAVLALAQRLRSAAVFR